MFIAGLVKVYIIYFAITPLNSV